MDILKILAIGTLNIVCFFIGTRLGQQTAKGEPIKMLSFNPLEKIREREAKRESEKEQEKIETIMQNIENYDGTARNQKDIPT